MHSELSNLWLFAAVLGKASVITGILPGLALATAVEFPYVYRWAKSLGMFVLCGVRKGQPCKVLIRAKRNSCLIQFPDGFQAITSRNALRKVR